MLYLFKLQGLKKPAVQTYYKYDFKTAGFLTRCLQNKDKFI